MMPLDSALHTLLSLGFTLLLLSASLHKFADRQQFQGILRAWRLLPEAWLPLFAMGIPLLELGLGLAWLTGIQRLVVALVTAALLAVYTLGIAINLRRGNTAIDCGCGGSVTRQATASRRLSTALLLRNGLWMGLALLALLPSNQRLLGMLDWFSLGLAGSVLLLLYLAGNQLLANRQLIAGSYGHPSSHVGLDGVAAGGAGATGEIDD